MREAVIVSTARTPLGKAYRGAFNNTESPTLAGHAIKYAVERAGAEPAEVDEVVMGCVLTQGSQGGNIARLGALTAGLPVTTTAMTVDRQCSSGMMAIAIAARQITEDGFGISVGGGIDSISLVQNEHMNNFRGKDPRLLALDNHVYMPMLDTAEVVAKRYNISREVQDQYALQSQQRMAAAQEAGRLDDEIVPMTSNKGVMDRESGSITAGNASQLSDGASACVLMEAKLAEQRGVKYVVATMCIGGGMGAASLFEVA